MIQPKWTIALFLVIVVDSIVTVIIGAEASPIILHVMSTLDIDLATMMVLRVWLVLPAILVIDRWYSSKAVLILYIIVYILGVAATFIA